MNLRKIKLTGYGLILAINAYSIYIDYARHDAVNWWNLASVVIVLVLISMK